MEGSRLEHFEKPPRADSKSTLICGRCKQEYDTLTAFLKHRAYHVDENGKHYCELCQAVFSSKTSALEHYTSHHQVVFGEDEKDTEAAGNKAYRIIEVGETDSEIIAVIADPDTEHVDEETEKVYNELVQKKLPETATDDYLRYGMNYKFAMEVVQVERPKFSFGKTVLNCLFCLLQANDIMVLSRHMFNSHKSFVNNERVDEYERVFLENQQREKGKKYAGQVLTLSRYWKISREDLEEQPKQRTCRVRTKYRRKLQPTAFPCPTCGKEFKQGRLRRVHMETHRTEKNFLCDECGKAFKSRTRLTAHRKSHKEKIFKCPQCDFQSKLHSAIHAHRQVHSQGCVLCHICGSAYTDRSTLTKHMAVHSMDRPYPCAYPGCTWRFKTEALCRAHFRAHTSKGRYKCEVCHYLFRHKHHLQRHLVSVHRMEIIKHQQLRPDVGILPANEEPPVPLEGGASDMQMIQVVLNQQVHQEVVSTDMQGIQVFKLFTT
ncbi:zinc finger protein 90-like [Patiria miniata]|uniref:C2H2-type domain-containing protein n=1 Tax=Patiria miniata TaxID=46514 RepID=A0A914AWD8_PATMI|nr:zinc finger protein 90-like [Patiria miniata]